MKTKKIVKCLKGMKKDVKSVLNGSLTDEGIAFYKKQKEALDAAIDAVKENEELKERIKELEKTIDDLKKEPFSLGT